MRTDQLKTPELMIVFLAYFLKQQVLGGKEGGGSISRNCVGAGRIIIECKAPKICCRHPVNLILSKRYSGVYAFELFSFCFFLFRSVWD